MTAGITSFAQDVRTRRYPAAEHGYSIPEEELSALRSMLQD